MLGHKPQVVSVMLESDPGLLLEMIQLYSLHGLPQDGSELSRHSKLFYACLTQLAQIQSGMSKLKKFLNKHFAKHSDSGFVYKELLQALINFMADLDASKFLDKVQHITANISPKIWGNSDLKRQLKELLALSYEYLNPQNKPMPEVLKPILERSNRQGQASIISTLVNHSNQLEEKIAISDRLVLVDPSARPAEQKRTPAPVVIPRSAPKPVELVELGNYYQTEESEVYTTTEEELMGLSINLLDLSM